MIPRPNPQPSTPSLSVIGRYDVEPLEDAFTINTGDIMQALTLTLTLSWVIASST